jgi:hypothetical protein
MLRTARNAATASGQSWEGGLELGGTLSKQMNSTSQQCPERDGLGHHCIHPNDDAEIECLFCRQHPEQVKPTTELNETGIELCNLQHIL